MPLAYSLTVQGDPKRAIQTLAQGIAPAKVGRIIGEAAADTTRRHYVQLNRERPNALGGARTNYYLGAAKSTHFEIVGDSVVVSAAAIGLRLHYFGGRVSAGKGISPITGKPTRFLTIPVNPKAYGHRASDFDLELVFNSRGQPVALATKATSGAFLTKPAGKRSGHYGQARAGRAGEIMYVLKRSVDIRPDPSVLPAPDKIYGAVISNVNAYVARIVDRAEGKGV